MSKTIKIGIDATNLIQGGGVTHLIEILKYKPNDNIKKIVIWGARNTLNKVEDKPWIHKKTNKFLNSNFLFRYFWIKFFFDKEIRNNCDLLFNPGGGYSGYFIPFVTMCRNMLVFDNKQREYYKGSLIGYRLKLLEYIQKRSFEKSQGLIFISNYAQNYVGSQLKINNRIKISHGVSNSFRQEPKEQKKLEYYTKENPYKLLYVSIIDLYKHQWIIAKAIIELNKKGVHIQLNLVGGYNTKAMKMLDNVLLNNGDFIVYHGKVDYQNMKEIYKKADGFIYGSTCENMPNILIEAMGAGLPIISSHFDPMPEFLKDSCIYFNPMDLNDIEEKIMEFVRNKERREEISKKSKLLSEKYSWEKCSKETFDYLVKVNNNSIKYK